ncbi:Dual Oxidase 2 [Manis pentadactyla]|nr:Dual Oxidase 2 [Manis pentadactyla]
MQMTFWTVKQKAGGSEVRRKFYLATHVTGNGANEKSLALEGEVAGCKRTDIWVARTQLQITWPVDGAQPAKENLLSLLRWEELLRQEEQGHHGVSRGISVACPGEGNEESGKSGCLHSYEMLRLKTSFKK